MMTPDGSRAWSSAGAAHRSGWAAAASGKSVLMAAPVISGGRDGVAGRNGRAVEGGDGGGPEALDRQVDADGELEDGDGEGAQKGGCGDLGPNAEDRHGVRHEDEGGTDQADDRNDAPYQAGPVEDVSQEQVVHTGHHARPEQERPLPHRDQ